MLHGIFIKWVNCEQFTVEDNFRFNLMSRLLRIKYYTLGEFDPKNTWIKSVDLVNFPILLVSKSLGSVFNTFWINIILFKIQTHSLYDNIKLNLRPAWCIVKELNINNAFFLLCDMMHNIPYVIYVNYESIHS